MEKIILAGLTVFGARSAFFQERVRLAENDKSRFDGRAGKLGYVKTKASTPIVFMQCRIFLSILFALTFAPSLTSAAPQTPMKFESFQPCRGSGSFCGVRILAKGVIEATSHRKLAAFITKAQKDELPPLITIMFDSPGGDMAGGVSLGQFIRSRGYDTALERDIEEEVTIDPSSKASPVRRIATNTMCASACSLAFFGGRARSMTTDARLGVHQFYSGTGSDLGESATQFTMTKLALYLEEMGVDRRILDFASSAGPSGMFWVPDTLGRELKIDNTRPLLADWQIDADDKGIPSLKVSQAVGPTTDLLLIMKNSGVGVNVTVLAVFAKDAPGIDRQSGFPVGEPLEVEFLSNYKVVAKATPLISWKLVQKTKDGGAVFGGAVGISHPDLQRMAKLQKLEITDNFSNAVRNLSISTELSVKKLAGGAELLVRTKAAR